MVQYKWLKHAYFKLCFNISCSAWHITIFTTVYLIYSSVLFISCMKSMIRAKVDVILFCCGVLARVLSMFQCAFFLTLFIVHRPNAFPVSWYLYWPVSYFCPFLRGKLFCVCKCKNDGFVAEYGQFVVWFFGGFTVKYCKLGENIAWCWLLAFRDVRNIFAFIFCIFSKVIQHFLHFLHSGIYHTRIQLTQALSQVFWVVCLFVFFPYCRFE